MLSRLKRTVLWSCAAVFSTFIHAAPASDIYSTSFAILSYAKWPSAVPEICVISNPAFAQQMKNSLPADSHYKISNKKPADLRSSSCSIIIFSTLSSQEEQHLLNTAVTYPALSISTNNPDCEAGSAFCLYKRNQNFAFKVNMESLTQSKIHIDPRVLLLAKTAESK